MAQGFAGSGTVGAGTHTLGMSNIGNTSGTSGPINGSAIQYIFAGGTNITLSQSTNGASATLSIIGGAGGGGSVNLSAGTTSQNLTNFVFSNSNGISFGLNGSTITGTVKTDYQTSGAYLTTAMQSNAATISNVKMSAGTLSSNRSDFTFADSNGISFGFNTNGVFTGTVKTDYQTSGAYLTTAMQSNAATISNINFSAGTTSQNLSKLTFSDSNGISFGLNGSVVTGTVKTDYQSSGAYLTTAMQSNAATISNINVSGGTTSQNLSKFQFNDSNGISFGLNGSTFTATVKTDYQTSGAYLTTAMQSNAATISNVNLSAGTTSNNLSKFVFSDGNGVSFGLNGSTVTASVAAAGGAQTGISGISAGTTQMTSGTASFANSNGISFGVNGNTITATVATNYQSQGAYLTTAMQSNAATISNINFSAGTTSNNLSKLTFADSNGISFGLNGSVVTGTVKTDYQTSGAYLTTAMQSNAATISNINFSAGTTSQNLSKLTFSDSNGISFGLNGSVVTGTVKTDYQSSNANYLTSQSNQALSGANGSFTFQTATFANSNGVSWSTGTQGMYATVKTDYLTTAMQSNAVTISNINFSAGTTSQNLSKITFSDSNGISFGLNGSVVTGTVATNYQSQGAYLTTAMLSNAATISNVNLSAGTTSNNLSKFVFADAGGVSFGLNGSTVTASAPAAAASPVNFSAGTTSNNLGSVVFSNSNGVSFGLNGSTITASAAGGGGGIALANSQTTYTSGTAQMVDGFGAITIASTTGQKFNFSVPATSSLSATGVVSISTNGSTISIGVPGSLTLSYFNPQDAYVQVAGQHGQGTFQIQPMQAPNVTFDRVMVPINYSYNNTASANATLSLWMGVYTRNASTLSQLTSFSTTQAYSASSTASSQSYAGLRLISISNAGLLLTEGQYWVGFGSSTSLAGAAGSMSQIVASQMNSNFLGIAGAGTNASIQYTRGLGYYSAATAGIPTSIAFSEIRGSASMALRQPIFYMVSGTV